MKLARLRGQWDKGKNCETFNPFRPWIATADEVADHRTSACGYGSMASCARTAALAT